MLYVLFLSIAPVSSGAAAAESETRKLLQFDELPPDKTTKFTTFQLAASMASTCFSQPIPHLLLVAYLPSRPVVCSTKLELIAMHVGCAGLSLFQGLADHPNDGECVCGN